MILFRFIILFFIFFIFASISLEAKNNINLCSGNNIINNVATSENILPSQISIEIKDNRKFVVNNLAILESNTTIKKKFKKRYSGKIKVFYKDNKSCLYKARIRLHGDYKDHIKFINGNIIQSLDVHLIDGNINGITKFKLLLPETKKNPKEEIIITEIFRSLNILAPRTFFINIDSQRTNYLALFQEKISKEFLEHNQRKEFILLEGDERFIYDDDKNDFGWESKLLSLAKVSNIELLKKSENFEKILLNSLSNLNRFYLSTKNYYENNGSFPYIYSKLNDELLNKSNSLNQKNKFSIFNSLIFATNSQHALIPHNRKFYWNGEYQTFEPIYYDGNINIDGKLDIKNFPKNDIFFQNIKETIGLISNLDRQNTSKRIIKNFNVLSFSEEQIDQKINKVISNLKQIEVLYDDISIKRSINQLDNYQNNLENYLLRIKNTKILPIFLNEKLNNFYSCSIESCYEIQLTKKELGLLINGNLKKNDRYFQFLGVEKIKNSKLTKINDFKKNIYKIINYKNTQIIYHEKEYLIENSKSDIIKIKQLIPNTKMIIMGGSLQNLTIVANLIPQEKNSNKKTFDIRGLTGCLNLIDLEVKNINIEISNGNCEDSVNIVRSKGTINELKIFNSSNDALDIDFSDISILKTNILTAGNDCIDLSFGRYKIEETNISDCGDKAISVGEKSDLASQNLNIMNANIGIASKDSSKVRLVNANFKNVEVCLAAYNKKQEFLGGFIMIDNFTCKNFSKKTLIDNLSIISLNNQILQANEL